MALITAADLTFNGEEIRSISEAVFESTFAKPEIEKFHTLVNGIFVKKQIAILGRLTGLVGLADGECDPSNGTNAIPMSEKFWQPVPVSDRLALCWKDLQNTFFEWGLKQGIEKHDLTNTDFANFVIDRMTDAMFEMIYRLAWFNDTSAALTTASPAGVITAGTTIGYFNKLNGLWKQLFAIAVADTDRLTTDLASRNGQATFALQKFTSTDTTNKVVTNALLNMEVEADFRLRGKANQVFIVTQSVYDQYKKELRFANVAFTTERIEGGFESLKADGKEVISFQFWDRMIRTYYSDGTKYYLPHRAILTTKENLQIGTAQSSSFSEMDIWPDKKTKKTYVDFQIDIDAKVIEDEMVQLAY